MEAVMTFQIVECLSPEHLLIDYAALIPAKETACSHKATVHGSLQMLRLRQRRYAGLVALGEDSGGESKVLPVRAISGDRHQRWIGCIAPSRNAHVGDCR
jgi:hypothetical protein